MSELNLDRMVRSATSGWAGEPYCAMIVSCLWQTKGWMSMSVPAIEAFWEGAAKSDLTVREFIDAKRRELS
jgi:hypothetical protein